MLLGYLVSVLPYVAGISAVIYLPYYLYSNRRYGRQTFLHHLVRYGFVGFCLSLVYLTLLWYYPYLTFRPDCYFLNLRPFMWMKETYIMGTKKMAEQLILNIGMFVPYGLLLPMAVQKTRKLWKAMIVVLCTTLAIETIQYFMGRSADIDDVIMNALGGLLGYGIFGLLRRVFSTRTWWKNMIGRR